MLLACVCWSQPKSGSQGPQPTAASQRKDAAVLTCVCRDAQAPERELNCLSTVRAANCPSTPLLHSRGAEELERLERSRISAALEARVLRVLPAKTTLCGGAESGARSRC